MIDWTDIIDKPRALAKRRHERRRKWTEGDVYHRTRAGRGVVGQIIRRR